MCTVVNTCPIGIVTQDPQLRAKFSGQPEQVISFFYYLAEELCGYMPKLGFRTINEMVGRADMLKVDEKLRTAKTAHLDLSAVLKPAWQMRPSAATYHVRQQDHKFWIRLDNKFIDESEPALTQGLPIRIECDITNTDHALGTSLSYQISKAYGEEGLPKNSRVMQTTMLAKGSQVDVSLSILNSQPSKQKRTSLSETSVFMELLLARRSFVDSLLNDSLSATLLPMPLLKVPVTMDVST